MTAETIQFLGSALDPHPGIREILESPLGLSIMTWTIRVGPLCRLMLGSKVQGNDAIRYTCMNQTKTSLHPYNLSPLKRNWIN